MGIVLQAGNISIECVLNRISVHIFRCSQVLFPLLYDLLTETSVHNIDASFLEESRMRSATIMSKVFLHHLTPLISLPTFSELWLEILDYIEKFMNVGSDMLHEAMLESLKNMLLVMHSVRTRQCLVRHQTVINVFSRYEYFIVMI